MGADIIIAGECVSTPRGDGVVVGGICRDDIVLVRPAYCEDIVQPGSTCVMVVWAVRTEDIERN